MPCGCKKKTASIEQDNSPPEVTKPTQPSIVVLNDVRIEDWRDDIRYTIKYINNEITDARERDLRIRAIRSLHPSRGRVAVSILKEGRVKKVFATAIRKKIDPVGMLSYNP